MCQYFSSMANATLNEALKRFFVLLIISTQNNNGRINGFFF